MGGSVGEAHVHGGGGVCCVEHHTAREMDDGGKLLTVHIVVACRAEPAAVSERVPDFLQASGHDGLSIFEAALLLVKLLVFGPK